MLWITNPPANESIANSADNLATISFDLGDNIEENENDPLKVLFSPFSVCCFEVVFDPHHHHYRISYVLGPQH